MSGKIGMRIYPYEIKKQAVIMHLEEGLIIREINV